MTAGNFQAAIFRHAFSLLVKFSQNVEAASVRVSVSDGFKTSIYKWPTHFARSKMWSTPCCHQFWRNSHILFYRSARNHSTHTSVHPYTRTPVHSYIRTFVHPYTRTSVHPYIRTSVHPYTRTSVRKYKYD